MYKLTKLVKYKMVFIVIFTLALGLIMSPALAVVGNNCSVQTPCVGVGESCVSGKCAVNTFGLGDLDDSELALGGSGDDEGLINTITQLINVALSLLGIVSVVIILIGGFKWMTAGGNEEKVDEARKLIFSGIIGMAIILSAWAIAKFVLSTLGEATGAIDAGTYDDLT